MALTPNTLNSFRPWLTANGYSASTVANYLSDIEKFFKYANDNALNFNKDTITGYIAQIADKNYSGRALASLNKFCQFALDQKIVSVNPLASSSHVRASLVPVPSLEDLILAFQKHLESHHKTPATIKNYINDLHQFIDWSKLLIIEDWRLKI